MHCLLAFTPGGPSPSEQGLTQRILAATETPCQQTPVGLQFYSENWRVESATGEIPGSTLGGGKLTLEQLIDHLWIGLAAGCLHDLAHQKTEDFLVATAIVRNLFGMGG